MKPDDRKRFAVLFADGFDVFRSVCRIQLFRNGNDFPVRQDDVVMIAIPEQLTLPQIQIGAREKGYQPARIRNAELLKILFSLFIDSLDRLDIHFRKKGENISFSPAISIPVK